MALEDNSEVWLAETFFKDLDNEDSGSPDAKFSISSLIEKQQSDSSLRNLIQTACSEEEAEDVLECYYIKSNVFMRKWRPPRSIVHQVVVPPCYRDEIWRIAHDILVAGHLGILKDASQNHSAFLLA